MQMKKKQKKQKEKMENDANRRKKREVIERQNKKFIMKHQVRNFCSTNSTLKNVTFE